tara:strand:+ start:431 stop:883 length:453 start_codon:yes stop_codon:yes gene_type:complete
MSEILNPKAYVIRLQALQIKQGQLNRDVNILLKAMTQRKLNIEKFENYYDEYLRKIRENQVTTLSQHQNNEQFLDKIMTVLMNEKDALNELELKRQNLIKTYHQNQNELENISKLLEQYDIHQKLKLEKHQENELYEIATNRKLYFSHEE